MTATEKRPPCIWFFADSDLEAPLCLVSVTRKADCLCPSYKPDPAGQGRYAARWATHPIHDLATFSPDQDATPTPPSTRIKHPR